MKTIFFDHNQVFYNLVTQNNDADLNWLFVPGGVGADSQYLIDFINLLTLPGKAWRMDMPGNGLNLAKVSNDYDFGRWLDIFVDTIKSFNNPILVGHSFGGVLPLMLPDLEQHLKGFVSVNSAPSLWYDEMYQESVRRHLPDISEDRKRYIENPTSENYQIVMDKITYYHFPEDSIESGRVFVRSLIFNTNALNWWRNKLVEINFTAQWTPQSIPMLIIGGSDDCTCPFSIYQNDDRFNQSNIVKHMVDKAGHFAWLDQPEKVKELFDNFLENLTIN